MRRFIIPFCCATWFVAGTVWGVFIFAPDSEAPTLVQCAEDEVWVADHARGTETVSDLSCQHVDEVAEQARNLVQCIPGEVWYISDASNGDDLITPSELECIDPFSMP